MVEARKTVIVTGGSRGIGAAVARRLGQDGYNVVVNFAGNQTEAEAVVAAIAAHGGAAMALRADVSDPNAVARLFAEAEARFGGVDVVVNSAGIMPAHLPPLLETDDVTFDRLMAVNVKGSFNVMWEAGMRLRDGGRIITFSTSVIGLALPGYAAYAATKAAVETMTNIFAKELRGRAITVNAVAPGPTATDLFLSGKNDEQIERLAKLAPLERLGVPEDIAAVVAFLAGPDAGWINGQTIRANGGIV